MITTLTLVISTLILSISSLPIALSMPLSSTFTKVRLFDRSIFIKRDDLLSVNGITGNKVRKLKFLDNINSRNFPHTIASYGGYQSNAMIALAKCIKHYSPTTSTRGHTRFVYFTKNIPHDIMNNPSGNLKEALSLGMEVCRPMLIM